MPSEFSPKKPTDSDHAIGARSLARATPAPNSAPEGKYGKENFDLLQKLTSLLDNGQKELLRKRYIDMLGVRHLSDTEQDKMLWTNRAYQKATADLEMQIDRQKRSLREVFDRAVAPFHPASETMAAPAPVLVLEPPKTGNQTEAAMKLRRERLGRLRRAHSTKLARSIDEYDKKKRLYDSKFENLENDAYTKGMARIEEDRKRYESLTIELEERMKREQEAFNAAQSALTEIETTRESARVELENTLKLEREIKSRVKEMLHVLKATLPGLESLAERLSADTGPDPRVTTKRGTKVSAIDGEPKSSTHRGRTVSDEARDPRTSTQKGLRPPKV